MDDRAKFTATVVVGDKFTETFNSIARIPLYHNCGRIVNTKSSRLMFICLDVEPRGYVNVMWNPVDGEDAIYIIIEGDAKFVKEMMLMIDDALKNHGLSLIDGEYEVSL
jgi:peroxiredoxin